MVASNSITLEAADRLGHDEACRLAGLAARSAHKVVVIDLSATRDASTAAFARLVLLRRELLQSGRDLHLVGLQHRARQLFEVHRLDSVLPLIAESDQTLAFPQIMRKSHRRPSLQHAVA